MVCPTRGRTPNWLRMMAETLDRLPKTIGKRKLTCVSLDYRRVLLQKRTVDWHCDRNDRTSTYINIGKVTLKISPNKACTVTNAELTGEAARSNGYSITKTEDSTHPGMIRLITLFFTNRNKVPMFQSNSSNFPRHSLHDIA